MKKYLSIVLAISLTLSLCVGLFASSAADTRTANLIKNAGFELKDVYDDGGIGDDDLGWTKSEKYEGALKQVKDIVHSGTYAVKMASRPNQWTSLAMDVTSLLKTNGKGGYYATAWMYCAKDTNSQMQLKVTFDEGVRNANGDKVYEFIYQLPTMPVKANTWTQVGTFFGKETSFTDIADMTHNVVEWGTKIKKAVLTINTTDKNDYYVDDVDFYKGATQPVERFDVNGNLVVNGGFENAYQYTKESYNNPAITWAPWHNGEGKLLPTTDPANVKSGKMSTYVYDRKNPKGEFSTWWTVSQNVTQAMNAAGSGYYFCTAYIKSSLPTTRAKVTIEITADNAVFKDDSGKLTASTAIITDYVTVNNKEFTQIGVNASGAATPMYGREQPIPIIQKFDLKGAKIKSAYLTISTDDLEPFYVDEVVFWKQTTPTSIPGRPNSAIAVKFDGSYIKDFDVPPQLIGGATMVPMRRIFNAFGFANENIKYENKTITATKDGVTIVHVLGTSKVTINGVEQTIINPDSKKPVSPSVIVGGRTLVPVRLVAACTTEYTVGWNGTNKDVEIVKK